MMATPWRSEEEREEYLDKQSVQEVKKPRYIDANLLIENIAKIEDLRKLSTKTIGEAISETPTADVEEVKHGEWSPNGICPWNNVVGNWRCSVCEGISIKPGNYCPNCGAKMDGERKDEKR